MIGLQDFQTPESRAEDRADRRLAHELDMERMATQTQAWTSARIAERDADARRRLAMNAEHRQVRAEQRAQQAAWIRSNAVGVLCVPTIVVPGLLAWTAMASWGMLLYGGVGAILPVFSEGAMWAFAAAVAITLRRTPDRPVWHLRLGIAVFAVFGAGLNLVHGAALPHLPGLPPGPVTGLVMAAISAGGVVSHQLLTAGPRRTRRARHDATIGRMIEAREFAARKDAVKSAPVAIYADGDAELIFVPTPATEPDAPSATEPDAPAATEPDAPAATEPDAPSATEPDAPAATTSRHDVKTSRRRSRSRRPSTETRIARLRTRHPDITNVEVAERLGLSVRTVQRYPSAGRVVSEPDPVTEPVKPALIICDAETSVPLDVVTSDEGVAA